MKKYDKLLTCETEQKEKVVLRGMKILGCYDSLQGHVMRREPLEVCKASTEKLIELYENAVLQAPEVLQNLYDCLYTRC